MTARLRPRILLPSLVLFFMAAALVVTKTARDGLYIEEGGVRDLPWAYLWIAAVTPMAGMAFVAGIRATSGRTMRLVGPLLISALQLIVPLVGNPDSILWATALFVLTPVVYGILMGAGWLLASELRLPGNRNNAVLYSTMGLGSLLGGLAGALLSRGLAKQVEPIQLIAVGGAVLGVSALVIWFAHRRFSPSEPGGKAGRPAGIRKLLSAARDRQMQKLLGIVFPASVAGVFIEFLFYLAAPGVGAGEANSVFFANFYLLATGLAITVSLAIPALQGKLGAGGSLMVLPVVLLGGSTFSLIAIGSGTTFTAMRLAESGLKSSIYRSSWEQSYLAIASSKRQVAKLLVDGLGARFGEAFGAALLLLGRTVVENETGWILGLLVPAVLVWTLTTRRAHLNLEPPEHGEWTVESFPRECCVITTTLGRETR